MLPRKAPTLAVKSFAELLKVMPARLVMAGDGELMPQVRETVAQLGVTEHVDLLGRVPWTEITRLYDSASVFLFCSLRDSSGAQFLEAMGRGLPAVTLDLHGMSDLKVGIAAEKVPLSPVPDDLPGDLAAALHRVLTADNWAARSASGIEWASTNTFPAKAAAATQIYKEIAQR
jgi:glycosyltransferase involved in cell wall biosynthesis